MKLNVSAQLNYTVKEASTLMLSIHALRTPQQTVLSERFTTNPEVQVEELQNVGGENRIIKLEIPNPCKLKIEYAATVNNNYQIINHRNLTEAPVGKYPQDVLPFLYPSRYCQSDKLYRFADHTFGDLDTPFAKVMALTNWIHSNVLYLSGSTNAQTSAFDTVTEQAGVCRDFAHLGIAVCRALTIPARYFTGYAYKLKPADFHACFEAYLGGQWVLFDATGLAPLNSMVKIATGRDAADAAVANIFGNTIFNGMTVDCTLAEEEFKPYFYKPGKAEGLSYL